MKQGEYVFDNIDVTFKRPDSGEVIHINQSFKKENPLHWEVLDHPDVVYNSQLKHTIMPFKSSQQSKACFASKGFGGKVDCKEWAGKTNYKTLPKKASKSKSSKKK